MNFATEMQNQMVKDPTYNMSELNINYQTKRNYSAVLS